MSELTALSPTAVAVIPIDGGGRWVIDRDGRLSAEGPAGRIDPVAGPRCPSVQSLVRAVEPVVERTRPAGDSDPAQPATAPEPAERLPADPQPTKPVATPVPPAAEPAPVAPAAADWNVAPGDTLRHIAQEVYGASGTAATASMVTSCSTPTAIVSGTPTSSRSA
jgi:hypothetical protein